MLETPNTPSGNTQFAPAASPAADGDSIPHRGIYSEQARLDRLQFLQERTGVTLSTFQETRLDSASLRGNIENFIGAVEIPVGAAGPLLVHRTDGTHLVYAPIATTEGALVASITRGAKAVSASGGVSVRAIRQRMTRAPLFECANLDQAILFADFVRGRFAEIQAQVKEHSNFAELKEVEPVLIGKTVHLRFSYETADAAGQNMTTICTWNACRKLLLAARMKGIQIEDFFLEGNLSTDKKASQMSISHGRGTRVVAECTLSRDAVIKHLKTTPEALIKLFSRAHSARFQSGMLGHNVNVANVIAGIYVATGQDIACVHESSLAQLHMETKGDGLYVSMTLPSLIVGTVGGGVRLPQQSQMLELMGCLGKGKSSMLAETIAAFALALDLSTLSAITGGQFAGAHERLGRQNHQAWLKRAELNPEFFASLCKEEFGETSQVLDAHFLGEAPMGESVLMDAASQVTKRFCGLFPYQVVSQKQDSAPQPLNLMLKIKPTDKEVVLATEMMAALCNDELAESYRRTRAMNPFVGCHLREVEVARIQDPRFTSIAPKIYGTTRDDSREIYVIAQELLTQMNLMNTASDVSGWDQASIFSAVQGISSFHSIWYGKNPEMSQLGWLAFPHTARSMTEMSDVMLNLAAHARAEFPTFFTASDFKRHQTLIESIPSWWAELERMPQTVIHNDFNPRNIALRKNKTLCAYDWELATRHLPQRDVAELLCFVLSDQTSSEELDAYLEHQRSCLEKQTGTQIDPRQWRLGFRYSVHDFMIYRLAMYFVVHTHKNCPFLERTYSTARHLASLMEGNA